MFRFKKQSLLLIFFSGRLVDVRMPRNGDGSNRGVAFVQFDTVAAAKLSLQKNQTYFKGRQLLVMPNAIEHSEKPAQEEVKGPR